MLKREVHRLEGKTVAARIHDLHGELTAAGRKTARGLLGNYPLLGLAPVADFASGAGVSAATVVRFVAQLGFKSYPDFQRALREELEERSKSPLQRPALAASGTSEGGFLASYLSHAAQRAVETVQFIPNWEFEAVCQKLAEGKGHCFLAGGRFTDFLAGYFEAHLRVIRPGVSRLDGRSATRADQMIDVRPGDMAVLFDVRRYDDALLDTAAELARRKAHIVLITDEWVSPVSRHARNVLPCRTETGRTWDANGAVLAVVEALIARTTELSWASASKRMGLLEVRGR